jgi:hypothetical protein
MKCLECALKYIGHTGRKLNIRYKEHIHAISSNDSNSGYLHHMLNVGHTYGTTTDTMDIKKENKGKYLNTLEKYYFYRINTDNLHMNDTYIDTHNPIFDTLHEFYARWQHTHSQSCYPSKSRISYTEH